MPDLITIFQVITGILLVVTILLQQRGTGMGGAFGGGGGSEMVSADSTCSLDGVSYLVCQTWQPLARCSFQ